MEESDMEEGEALHGHKSGDYYGNIDPDIALSYIDYKIQDVLGHFQKDFEGGLSAESLGAKFGGYGSFLPSYQRPPSIQAQPKSPERDHNPTNLRSGANHQMESARKSFMGSSNASLLGGVGTASNSSGKLHTTKLMRDLCSNHAKDSGKQQRRAKPPKKAAKLTDRRTLKVRIKMGSDDLACKNSRIYSGLGLDISPSSSSGNSTDDPGSIPAESESACDETSTSILQMMTTFPLAGSVLLSPLNEDLMQLKLDIRFERDSKTQHIPKESPRHYLMSLGELDVTLNMKESIKKGSKLLQKVETPLKRQSGNGNTVRKTMAETRAKLVSLPDSTTKDSGKATRDTLKDWLFSSDAIEESSDQEFSIKEGRHSRNCSKSSTLEDHCDGKDLTSHKEVLAFPRDDFIPQGAKTSNLKEPPDSHLDASLIDTSIAAPGHLGKPIVDREALSGEKAKNGLLCRPGKNFTTAKKKLTGSHSSSTQKRGSSSGEESLRSTVAKEKKKSRDNIRVRNGMQKTKEDTGVAADNVRSLVDLKRVNERGDTTLRLSGVSVKENFEENQGTAEDWPSSEVVPVAPMPVYVEENWVQCDNCQKWRLLPSGVMPDQLPEKWLCSMLDWLPGMNRCDVSEEETTKALNLLYQFPVSESQASLPNNSNAASVAGDLTNGSGILSVQGKKKHGSREVFGAGKGGTAVQMFNSNGPFKESGKRRGLKDAEQFSLKPKVRKSSKLNNSEVKEKHMVQGDSRHVRMKIKSEADHSVRRTSKRIKTENESLASGQLNSDPRLDLGKVGVCVNKGTSTKSLQLEWKNCDDNSHVKNLKPRINETLLDSTRKVEKEPDIWSFDKKSCNTKDIPFKRRKLHEWQDVQNNLRLSQDWICKEGENMDGEVKTTRKIRVSNGAKEEIPITKGNGKSHKKNKVTHDLSSFSRDHSSDIISEVKSIEKSKKLMKLNGEVPSKQIVSGHISVAANSSSSKISCSYNTKGSFEEVRGSPVESVSSSPLRTTNMNTLTADGGNNIRKDGVTADGLQAMVSPIICLEGECNDGSARSEENEKPCHASHIGSHESCVIGDRSACPSSVGRNKSSAEFSSELESGHLTDNDGGTQGRNSLQQQPDAKKALDYYKVQDEPRCNRCPDDALYRQKSATACGLQAKEKDRGSRSCKDATRELVNDKREECVSKPGGHMNDKDIQKTGQNQKFNQEQLFDQILTQGSGSKQTDSRNGTSKLAPNQSGKHELVPRDCQSAPGLLDVPQVSAHTETVANRNGACIGSGSSSHDPPALQDVNGVMNKDPSIQPAKAALKEAEELRNYADRLKGSGFGFESNEAYFQAALKFLDTALQFETCNSNGHKQGEMTQMDMYNITAKLCESCAQEYERRQEMAAAALAYKCMEVAYMKIVYWKHFSIMRIRNELQATLHVVPQGESPSSSASDVDNMNNQGSLERAALSKSAGAHIAGIGPNRNFTRLFDFTQDVIFAIEATKNSQNAFADASSSLEQDVITCVKRVIDFSFEDIERLVFLVRAAMEAICR